MARHRIAAFRDCEAALRNRDLKQALYDAGKVVMEGVLLTLHGEEHAARRAVRPPRGSSLMMLDHAHV